ncbi:hypothetical protein FHETE_896 [Fusarium heterosporum]|uniref:Uncharacterized protein n=1 Tax=Fusarium heterosporum TaxID=42747 RepID=A0A8H5U0Z1_FUSHE|nr:hypothetical protein FHETE_896 [Fusarium heterosporum]
MENCEDCDRAFKNQCRNFFLTRYRSRVATVALKTHPIPDNSLHDLLAYLLADKEFYQARIYISGTKLTDDRFDIMPLLWESLGTVPHDFMVLCDTMVNQHSPFSKNYTGRPVPAHFYLDRPFPSPSVEDLALYFTTWDLTERDLAYGMVQHSLWAYRRALYMANLGEFWGFRPQDDNRIYPLEFGLMVFIEEQWRELAWVYLDNALSTVPDFPLPEHAKSSFIDDRKNDAADYIDEGKKTARAVHVLFSAAGTGKTQQIFRLLQEHWGFYMLAPNLEPTPASPADTEIIEPRRYSASRDTYTVYEDHPLTNPKWDSDSVNVFRPIVVARAALLAEFLRRHAKASPRIWLWLQISCKTFDPFDALYRLFRLSDPSYLGLDSVVSIKAEMPRDMVPDCYALLKDRSSSSSDVFLYHCLDEAQYTFWDPEALSMFYDLYESLTEDFMMQSDWQPRHDNPLEVHESVTIPPQNDVSFNEVPPWNIDDGMPEINHSLLVSGTSLEVQRLEEILAQLFGKIWGDDDPPPEQWTKYQIHTVFPLIASDSDFWMLYEKHLTDIISDSTSFRDSPGPDLPLLSRSGRPLTFQLPTEDTELAAMGDWLWKPLNIPALPDIIRLLNQAYLLVLQGGQTLLAAQKNLPFTSLEVLLDHGNSVAVALAIISHLILPLHYNAHPQLGPLGDSLLRLLASFGSLHVDQVSQDIRNEAPRPPDTNICLKTVADSLHAVFRNLFIRDTISTHSTSHRGRYRWSTIYIEEILLLSLSDTFRNSSLRDIRLSISKAKHTTYDAAVTALKSQIRKMRACGKTELAQDLFRAAIRAGIMSMPSIFMKNGNAELVTYGFALVQREGDSICYTLAEPIAVHAVMDYLRTEGRVEYQELMLQWLINTQEDHEVRAMFGKATEWFMAMSLDYMLRLRPSNASTLPDLLNGSARRETLLNLLSSSVMFDSESGQLSNLKSIVDMSEFGLSDSPSFFNYDYSGTIWKWMKQYRVEGQTSTPTFLFPDINAGPDLVFILEGNDHRKQHPEQTCLESTRKILVAVQIKTGGGARFEGAMETLIESNWHRNLDEKVREAECAESDQWLDTPFILLLICTGITVKQDKIDKWIRMNFGRIPKGRFVCVLDETVTSSLWGEDFVALADAIKRQGTQQKEASSRYRDKRGASGDGTDTLLVDRSRKRTRPS